MLTRRLLEKFGYKVRVAAAGPEALDIWNEHGTQVDLLLTDMIMPLGLGGGELAELLRARKPELKVVFMSGYSPEVVGQQTEFVRRTNGSFVPKPCQPRELLRAVRNCLDGAVGSTRQS
jgi:CheY-like chemotaxis protein